MAFKYGCYVLRLLFLFLFNFAPVAMGMAIVDDIDPQMVFSNAGPSWWGATSHNGAGDLVGGVSKFDRSKTPYKFTWHEVLGDGAFVSMTFTGTRVNLTGTICRTGYPTTVDFYIDGQYMSRFQHIPEDRTLPISASSDIYLLYTMADFDNLSPAEHTLKAISVGAETLFVVDFIAYDPSDAVLVPSNSVSPSSEALSTIGSTNIGPTTSTTKASGTVSASLFTSSSSISVSRSTSSQSTVSTVLDDSQPIVAAMDVPASDSHIVYSPPGAWLPYRDARRATSCLEGTVSSSTAGSYLTYNFTGITIQVYTVSSLIGGNYSVSIDGGNRGIFTSYAASEDLSNCSSRPVYSTTGLNDTQHILVLTAQDPPAGSTQDTIQFVGFRLSSSPVGAPSSSNSGPSGPNIGAIIGGVVGGLAGFILIVLLILWWMRRQRHAEEALLEENLDVSTSSTIDNNPFTSVTHSESHIQGQATLVTESMAPPAMIETTPSAVIVPSAPIAHSSIYGDTSTERSTYYTLPPYRERVMQQFAARNLSEADVEAISRRLGEMMRNQAIQSGGNPSEFGNMMPPRELIDHLVQEQLHPPTA